MSSAFEASKLSYTDKVTPSKETLECLRMNTTQTHGWFRTFTAIAGLKGNITIF